MHCDDDDKLLSQLPTDHICSSEPSHICLARRRPSSFHSPALIITLLALKQFRVCISAVILLGLADNVHVPGAASVPLNWSCPVGGHFGGSKAMCNRLTDPSRTLPKLGPKAFCRRPSKSTWAKLSSAKRVHGDQTDQPLGSWLKLMFNK